MKVNIFSFVYKAFGVSSFLNSLIICFADFFPCWNLGEDASLPITSGGSYQVLVNNVFYFTQRVVDKLWQGMFNKESKLLIDFIIQLIAQVIHCHISCRVHVFLLRNFPRVSKLLEIIVTNKIMNVDF